jgi:hypothetical protein
MKRLLLIPLILISLIGLSQDKLLIDQHALAETLRKGETGLEKTEMSIYASDLQIVQFINNNPDRSYFTFPEARGNSIRLLDGITAKWAALKDEELTNFKTTVQPGEFFTFQIGVFAYSQLLENVNYKSTGLEGMTCFNLQGVNHLGEVIDKNITIKKGAVQPLWFGFQIPENASGTILGTIQIQAKNAKPTSINVSLLVSGEVVKNSGFDDGNRLSRMAWLNSEVGHDDEVTKGYIPIKREGRTFDILGRQITIGKSGLPQEINTFFDLNNQDLNDKSTPVLADGLRFIIETPAGKKIKLKPGEISFTKEVNSTLKWEVTNQSKEFELKVLGTAEFDGFMAYELELTSLADIEIKDIRLEIPMTNEMSGYMMGMNKEGGNRPETWNWKWDVANKSQDAVWVGGVNGGLRLKLKDNSYHRQLVNIYYEFYPLNLPNSWGNSNRGGCNVLSTSKGALVKAYSGERNLKKDETLNYDFELLVTPVKLINKDIQYNDRYYHSNSDVSANFIANADKAGANIINIHHKKDINPFINYPYLPENLPSLNKFIADAHAKNIRTKLYYTTRELTVNTPEIWAMRSLNGEVIFPGPGKDAKTVINKDGPHPWLIDNFKTDFIPAWKCTFNDGKYKGRQDLSVLTMPDSRLNNFYLAGLDWMCKNMKIDGVYIDDSALDRITMKRSRKILDNNRPNARIDMHTWNHFNGMAGYACCLNLYMDLLPYYDQLWIGEGRSYDKSPDYWLIETVGIPFGLTSQMLQGGGNPWRGMIFGMTNRLGWYGQSPENIWKFWDKYNFQEKEMIGFWDANCPVKTDNSEIIATIYKGKKQSIIAIANWTKKKQRGKLLIDWKSLGLDPSKVKATIPKLENFQHEKKLSINKAIDIKGGEGYLIVIEQK